MSKAPRPRPATNPAGAENTPRRRRSRRLLWRLERVAVALDISRRALERERSAGRFPPPDLTIGRMPLWRPATIRAWIASGAKGVAR